ncbi:polyketide cyclase [Roseomonas gilardii]|uniref:Polyketide cyclase n=1 Tax=Roseomonas gilardii TaxID=257708 RepID=A0A1L7AFI7_9PROT|nr:polyketide cyclase [Roseomonas gilardii]APT57480.1 polyketide cyclase [Roseomonas gilardii]MDT8330621.1 polyketide cyclase [Roseomonas gilardii]
MLEARTLSITVARDWRALYEALWQPESFPLWASGLSTSPLEPDGDAWKAQGPEGPIRIRFTGHNAFGVMDHRVELQDGRVVHVPMRVIANGEGAEVMLTLYRQPGMSEDAFRRDQDWVRRDLQHLRERFAG